LRTGACISQVQLSSAPSGMTVSCFDFAQALAVAIGSFCEFPAEARRVG
jgi:hypothetical protein